MIWWNATKKLTYEQEKLIAFTQQKWRKLAVSTDSINRQSAAAAIKSAYQLIGNPAPDIIFFDSPYRALKTVLNNLVNHLDREQLIFLENLLSQPQEYLLESELIRQLVSYLVICLQKQLQQQLGKPLQSQLDKQIKTSIDIKLSIQLDIQRKNLLHSHLENKLESQKLSQLVRQQERRLNSQLLIQIFKQLGNYIHSRLAHQRLMWLVNLLETQQLSEYIIRLGNLLLKPLFYHNCINSELWAIDASYFESYIYMFDGENNHKKWQLFQSLVINCGWIFPYEHTCIVCERPIKLSLDSDLLPHGEGEFALLFADGYSLYSNHGVLIPRKYGQVHPSRWEVQWILEEENPEIRHTLIKEIGYARICQELSAKRLDAWREYTLLRLDDIIDDIDRMPIYLLKMSCPSTGMIHALRVPPDIKSARDAIRWVNWGVDPDLFVMES
ncbi:MAG: hypothetical protein VKL59_03970 [Nostocaceae cyanobacterium]|nr:hypothetical protein [Nostocaceae cyanobacterium]